MSGVEPVRALVLLSSLQTAGAERVTTSFLRALVGCPDVDAELCTLTARFDGPLAVELASAGVVRRDLGAARLLDPFALLRLVRHLRGRAVDVVHAHGQDAAIMGLLACRLSAVPIVITRHVLEEPMTGAREWLRARLALVALAAADAVVAVSAAVARSLASLGVSCAARVIRNGVELERFGSASDAAAGARLREELGLLPTDPLVVAPAALRAGKEHEVLIDAFATVQRGLPRACLAIVGDGPRAAELRSRAEPLGAAVRFVGNRADVSAWLAAADVVVLASRSEAYPTVLLEAAASARVVVASAVGGAVEIVEAGVTGLLVPASSAPALAAALTTLCADRPLARGLGVAARARAEAEYGLSRQTAATIRLWREVAGVPG